MTSIANIKLEAADKDFKTINVIIDTPKLSRNKYKYDEQMKIFKLTKILPLGTSFPYDFGFIPQTKGQDGDPLDVLVLMDEPSFPGCWVRARVLGSLAAEQNDQTKRVIRNDRILAVAEAAQTYGEIKSLDDLNPRLLFEIEQFFIYYNKLANREFRIIYYDTAENVKKIIKDSISDIKINKISA